MTANTRHAVTGQFLPTDEEERFWSKVDRSGGPSACWPWLCGRDKDGYGKFWMRNGRTIRAHRYAVRLLEPGNSKERVGKHSCDHPWCCNPAHVSVGSQAQNQAEKAKRGRSLQGTKHHQAKIDEETALLIKRRYRAGDRCVDIARDLGLRKGHVHMVARHTWRHLDGR